MGNLKKMVKERMAKTGESWQSALRHVRAKKLKKNEVADGNERINNILDELDGPRCGNCGKNPKALGGDLCQPCEIAEEEDELILEEVERKLKEGVKDADKG